MSIQDRKQREFKLREERILNSAIKLFLQTHPSLISLDQIAKEAEVGRTTIYLHFANKDELIARFIYDRYSILNDKLKSIKIKTTPKENLKELIHVYLNSCLENSDYYLLQRKCESIVFKDNLSKDTLLKADKQREERLQILESFYDTAKSENKMISAPTFTMMGAVWGMLRGSVDIILEKHFQSEIKDTKKYFKTVEKILLQGLFLEQ